LAEQYLAQQIEEELLPESERELKRVKQEKAILEKRMQEEESKRLSEQEQQAVQYAQQEITNQIITALDGSSLPKTPDVVKRIAQYMYMAEQRGVNVHPKHIIPMVDEDLRNLNAQILRSLDPASRISYLGEDTLKQIRQDDLARIKQPVNNGSSKSTAKPMSRKMTKEEFRKEIASRVKG
jgi:hypothetical protein